MSYTIHRQGPDDSRYIIEAETGRFVARMDNEATDGEWHTMAEALELLTAHRKLQGYTIDHKTYIGRDIGCEG